MVFTTPLGMRVMKSRKGRESSEVTMSKARRIAELAMERALRADEVVHHVNLDSGDDQPENLVVLSEADHAALHKILKEDRFCAPTPAMRRRLQEERRGGEEAVVAMKTEAQVNKGVHREAVGLCIPGVRLADGEGEDLGIRMQSLTSWQWTCLTCGAGAGMFHGGPDRDTIFFSLHDLVCPNRCNVGLIAQREDSSGG